jgi:hypothetical protein
MNFRNDGDFSGIFFGESTKEPGIATSKVFGETSPPLPHSQSLAIIQQLFINNNLFAGFSENFLGR